MRITSPQRLYWSAYFSLVADIAPPVERDRWYGLGGVSFKADKNVLARFGTATELPLREPVAKPSVHRCERVLTRLAGGARCSEHYRDFSLFMPREPRGPRSAAFRPLRPHMHRMLAGNPFPMDDIFRCSPHAFLA